MAFFLLQLSLFSFAQTVSNPVIADGRSNKVIEHLGYTVSYNVDYKIPNWVFYELTDKEVDNVEVERNNKFVPDPDLPRKESAVTDDYKGYREHKLHRGHMAPARDMVWNYDVMCQSFYLSNICPQNGSLNSGDWNDLEDYVRDLAQKYHSVYVVCGPIVTDDSYRIGANRVVVPQAFYKVLLYKVNNKWVSVGYVMKNKPSNQPLISYALTVNQVEEMVGIDFFVGIPELVESVVAN